MRTPRANAANGRQPNFVSSRNRVVKPIDRNVHVNAHPRRVLSGPIASFAYWVPVLVSTDVRMTVTSRDATKKPMTNLGKRLQISPRRTRSDSPPLFRSQRVTDRNATRRAQTPTNMSRPTTFMSVKVLIARSSPSAEAAAKPAASANSEVPIQAPAIPGASPRWCAPNGRTKIIATAHRITIEIATETWDFSARHAPPMAMAAETPQIEPPAPRVAPNRLSRPNTRVAAR